MALWTGFGANTLTAQLKGTGLLTVAICSMHFTAMGAANFDNCYAVDGADGAAMSEFMPFAVAGISLLIGLAALTGVWLEMRHRRRNEREADRMRGLANAAVEGPGGHRRCQHRDDQ